MTTGLVIGATGGIGAACVEALAGSVAQMIVSGRDTARLEAVRALAGPDARSVVADISETQGLDTILSAVRDGGPLRWVVIASGSPLRGPLAELDEAAISATFHSNLIGPALLLRRLSEVAWVPRASVVMIGSTSAARPIANRSVYAASKAGMERLAAAVAAEWAPRGIRVNVVAPGIIATPFLGSDSARLDAYTSARVPSGRSGQSAEVAELVRYLALEAPDYVVGSRIVIDGGLETII